MAGLRERFWQWLGRGLGRPISYEYACERAARGAAYLDDVNPGWHEQLDPDLLQLASGRACVLGQLHGDFRLGLGRASLFNMGTAPRASLSPVHFGFMCVQGVSDELADQDYVYLNRAWREEIRRRQDSEGYPGGVEQIVEWHRSFSREQVTV